MPEGAFEWQVPGLRHDLVTELIRSLPKPVRRHLAPAPDNARRALEELQPHEEPLLPALSRELGRLAGVPVPVGDFDWEKVPPHLRVRVRVTGRRGKEVAAGKTVQEVGREAAGTVQEAISASARRAGLEVEGLTSWTVGDLPREFSTAGPGGPVTGYPALLDVRGRVDVRVLPSRIEQERAMRRGTRRLLLAGASVPSAGTLHGRLGQRRPARAHPRPARLAGRAGARRRRGRGRRRRRPARRTGLGRSGFRAAAGRRRP